MTPICFCGLSVSTFLKFAVLAWVWSGVEARARVSVCVCVCARARACVCVCVTHLGLVCKVTLEAEGKWVSYQLYT